ncbi:MAG: hypothetical protein Q9195_008105 [Heterodermia aff. obscurata]
MKLWTATLLRAFGLQLLGRFFDSIRHPVGKGLHEKTKVAISQDRLVAFLRALIHLVPVGVAMYEIILNWNTYYVGTASYSQAFYQTIAKVHEIMIQASVAAIVLTYIRKELAVGEGIPFGLLFAGLQISQISYLWSLEYWGSVRTAALRSYSRLILLVLIPISIILATVCGPASAVLLVPRQQFWQGGATDIWINATQSELWPDRMDDRFIPSSCSVIVIDDVNNICPSSGWQKIRDFILITSRALPEPYKDHFGYSEGPEAIQMASGSSIRQLSIREDESFMGKGPEPLVASVQHAAISDAVANTAALWFLSLTNVTAAKGHGVPLSDQSDATHTVATNYSQPYSSVACVPDSINGTLGSERLAFPVLLNANSPRLATGNLTYQGCLHPDRSQTIDHPSILRRDAFEYEGPSDKYRIRWIELPQDQFEGSSIGAVIYKPRDAKNSTQDVLLCNMSAGWGVSELSLQTVAGGMSAVSSKGAPFNYETKTPSIKLTNIPASETDDSGATYAEFVLPYFPKQPIVITESWAKYLDPSIEGLNSTLIDVLLKNQVFSCSPRVTAEEALTGLLVNGLSRTGAGSRLQGSVRTVGPNGEGGLDGNYWLSGKGNVFDVNPEESVNWTRFHVESTLEGHAYNTINTPPKIAIAVLSLYCLLALGHVFYAGITGISSSCWDSMAEVTVLAMNSTPTAALRNTCAGISELSIFKLPIRILVKNDVEGEGEHLELSFGDSEKRDPAAGETIKMNRAYGTMPRIEKGIKAL